MAVAPTHTYRFLLLPFLLYGALTSLAAQPLPPSSTPTPDPEALAPLSGKFASLITKTGIGLAKIGMPIMVLRNKLIGDFQVKSVPSFLGDFDATAIELNGEILFYLLHLPDFTPEKIGDILTKNPRFQTEEGLHAGMTLAEAEKICGKATLYYSENNANEEFVTFANQPFANVRIRPSAPGQPKAGIYTLESAPETSEGTSTLPEPDAIEGRMHLTEKFHPTAIVDSITVTAPEE